MVSAEPAGVKLPFPWGFQAKGHSYFTVITLNPLVPPHERLCSTQAQANAQGVCRGCRWTSWAITRATDDIDTVPTLPLPLHSANYNPARKPLRSQRRRINEIQGKGTEIPIPLALIVERDRNASMFRYPILESLIGDWWSVIYSYGCWALWHGMGGGWCCVHIYKELRSRA